MGGIFNESQSSGAEPMYSRQVNQISFTVSDGIRSSGDLERLVSASDKAELANTLTHLTNRVLRSLRNFGFVPEIHELKAEHRRPERLLRRWEAAVVREDGTTIALG